MEVIIFVGIQASGKTTFYRERFFETHVRISLDLLKTRHREAAFLRTCLSTRQRCVIDNTNPTVADRVRYIEKAKEAGFRIVAYFFEPDPAASYERNQSRDKKHYVPPAGLFGTLKNLERPVREEGFDELYRVRAFQGVFEVERIA